MITKEIDPPFSKTLELFEEGRKQYVNGNWVKAVKIFENILRIEEDGPSSVYLKRSKELLAKPPQNWDGIFQFTTK